MNKKSHTKSIIKYLVLFKKDLQGTKLNRFKIIKSVAAHPTLLTMIFQDFITIIQHLTLENLISTTKIQISKILKLRLIGSSINSIFLNNKKNQIPRSTSAILPSL